MTTANGQLQHAAISRELAERLGSLGEKQTVCAMVMLHTGVNGEAVAPRQSRQERKAAIESVRQASRAMLPEIDRILEHYDGKRLSKDVDALGSITVETTVEGIKALAASEHVKAILEDRSIFQLPQPERNALTR
jgi:hypothetical protein